MKITAKNLLLQELAKRQTRNSAYSLRAFARDLSLGVTTLSDVLADKRNLSKTSLAQVMKCLSVSPLERDSLWSEHKHISQRNQDVEERLLIDEDTFRLIADWHYLAILNIAKIKNNRATQPVWIAKRLGIKEAEATEALERLFRLGLVVRKKQELIRTVKPLTTTSDIPSAAIRKHHSQNLRLAEHSLHHDSVLDREIGSVTMAVNTKNLPLAKKLLLNTRKKIASLLEQGQVSEVYTLAFQLFPLTKIVQTKKG